MGDPQTPNPAGPSPDETLDAAAFQSRGAQPASSLPSEDETLAPSDSQISASQSAPRNARAIAPGDRIDRYVIIEQIGEGGFGSVFIAEQREPIRREVALKVVKAGMDSEQVLGRFEAERQALALMDHTNIAAVYDGGVTPYGGPYFVMELVRGMPISEYCDRHKLELEERLRIFISVCRAVQHAHQKGVIHRDIKPSNLLVGLSDGRPIAKVIDFGVAKALHRPLTDNDVHTLQHQPIGTPEYMSPEQAEMSGLDLDTRTDIYSLGVVLYELIAGSTPFDHKTLVSGGYAGMTKTIREKDPPRPSGKLHSAEGATRTSLAAARGTTAPSLEKALRRDLDWVVLKCLEKDRNRRYETADALAADVQHFLDNQPVEAGPPSKVYRARKFVRRNRAGVAAASVALLAVISGGAAATIGFITASVQRDRAVAALNEAEIAREESEAVTDFLAGTLAAADPGAAGRHVTVREVIDQAAARIGPAMQNRPTVESRLRQTIGETYLALGLLEAADAQLPRAYELASTPLPDRLQGPASGSIASSLAVLRAEQGRFDESREFARAAAETDPLGSARSLARAAEAEADFDEAIRILEDAIAAAEQTDPDQATPLKADLAQVLRRSGNLETAESTQRAVLDAQRTSLGPAHPDTISSLADLAAVVYQAGRRDEAKTLYLQTIDAATESLGPRHPLTLESGMQLAQIYVAERDLEAASEAITAVAEAQADVLGPTHPDTLTSRSVLGVVLVRQGKAAEAVELLTEVAEAKAIVLGADHPSTLSTDINLANAVRSTGRGEDAARMMQAALLKQRRVVGPDHPNTLGLAMNLATVYENLGQLEEAESLLTDTLNRGASALGAEHPYVALTTANLANVYFGQQRYEEADATYLAADAALASALGETHPNRTFVLSRHAAMLTEWGRPNQATCLKIKAALLRMQRDATSDRAKNAVAEAADQIRATTSEPDVNALCDCAEPLLAGSADDIPTEIATALIETIQSARATGESASRLVTKLSF